MTGANIDQQVRALGCFSIIGPDGQLYLFGAVGVARRRVKEFLTPRRATQLKRYLVNYSRHGEEKNGN